MADSVIYGFNEGLEWTAELGLAGVVLILGIGYLLFRRWKNVKEDQPALSSSPKEIILALAVLVSWLVFSMFSYPLSVPVLAMAGPLAVAGLNTGLGNGTTQIKRGNVLAFLPAPVLKTSFIIIVLGSSVYGMYWIYHYRPLAQKWISANANRELQRYEVANTLYKELYPHFRDEGLFLQYAGKSHSLAREFSGSEQLLERALHFSSDPVIFTTLGKDYTLFNKMDPKKQKRAEFLLQRVRDISPNKYYPRYLLAKFYNSIGNKEKAKLEAEELLAITPKVESEATKEIRLEMSRIINEDLFELTKDIR